MLGAPTSPPNSGAADDAARQNPAGTTDANPLEAPHGTVAPPTNTQPNPEAGTANEQEGQDEFSHRDSHVPFGGPDSYLFRFPSAVPTGGSLTYPTEENQPTPVAVVQRQEPFPPQEKKPTNAAEPSVQGASSPSGSGAGGAAGVASPGFTETEDQEMYPVVRPMRKKSVMQRKAQYKPVTEQVLTDSFVVSDESMTRQSSAALKLSGEFHQQKNRGKITEIVDGLHNETHGDTAKDVRIIEDGASLDMFSFVIGEPKKRPSYDGHGSFAILGSARSQRLKSTTSRSSSSGSASSSSSSISEASGKSPSTRKTDPSPSPVPSPANQIPLRHVDSSSTPQFLRRDDEASGDYGKKGKVTFADVPSSEDEPDFARPTAQAYKCVSEENLTDDTVSFYTYLESLQSPTLYRSIIFALRTVLVAVMPAFVLVTHPNTKDWFKGGMLVPVVAALFARQLLGMQLMLLLMSLQGAAFFITWGVVMNAVGAKDNDAGWWCAVLFGPLVIGLFGQVLSKRFMMMYVVIIMQTEHMPGGTALTFPCYFGRDIILGGLFGLASAIVPYPSRAAVRADECLLGVAKLLGLSTANITKSFWAPVNIDARASVSQVPFAKIDSLIGVCRQMIAMAAYEPFEWSLNNQLRTERVQYARRIMILLHCAYGAAQKRIEDLEMRRFEPRGRLSRHLEARMRPPAEDLSKEIMKSLVAFGKVLVPKDVANVDTSELDEKAQLVTDLAQQCRRDLLYYRGATSGEVNMVLNACVFHESLVDVAKELRKLKDTMVNFDPTKYKSSWERAKEFFFFEYWNPFWDELPRRLTLATPYDVRMWKDSLKFSFAFVVACAFTLRVDPGNVYFFGMAILMRLAQQTASETLQIGIMRIFGLCIGASLSYITKQHTHRYVEEVLLTMTFVFVALCFVNNPTLVNGAQYTLLVSMTGLSLAGTPALLMTRVSDNVFAFISYFLICTFIFPLDPMRILWNTRTKLFQSVNDIMQQCVALASTPVTRDKNEIKETLAQTQKLLLGQHALMREYTDWMTKSETEPLLRGGDYPTEGCRMLLRCMSYITAIQELMFYAIQIIHRDRSNDPVKEVSLIFLDAMDVYRPFMEDMGRIVYAIMQDFIYSTERSTTWTVEGLLHSLWKGNCAIKGLHRLIGNIQKNYIAALLELTKEERMGINPYMSSSFVNDNLTMAAANAALAGHQSGAFPPTNETSGDAFRNVPNTTFAPYGVNDSFGGKGDAWNESRILANSFQMTPGAMWSIQDTKAFGTLATASELFLKSMSTFLQPMVRIHEFEKSRHILPG